MSADVVTALRARAQQIRDKCNTFGNFLEGTTDSCAAAADALDDLADKLVAAPTDAKIQRAAARVLGVIGDGSDLAAGSNLADLAHDIAASAKVTSIGLGIVAAVALGLFVALKLSR